MYTEVLLVAKSTFLIYVIFMYFLLNICPFNVKQTQGRLHIAKLDFLFLEKNFLK